jgi:hypothetical protein
MPHKESLHSRAAKLIPIFDKEHGEVELILKVLDLENELAEAREALQAAQNEAREESAGVELPDSIEISEFVIPGGFLSNPPGEKTWIETLRHKTKMDVRAILSELPTEVGLYTFSFVYKRIDKLLHAQVKVWVVPVAEGN